MAISETTLVDYLVLSLFTALDKSKYNDGCT